MIIHVLSRRRRRWCKRIVIGEEDVEEMWAVAAVVSVNPSSPWMKSWSHTMGEEAHVVVTSYSNRHLCNMLSVDTLLS